MGVYPTVLADADRGRGVSASEWVRSENRPGFLLGHKEVRTGWELIRLLQDGLVPNGAAESAQASGELVDEVLHCLTEVFPL